MNARYTNLIITKILQLSAGIIPIFSRPKIYLAVNGIIFVLPYFLEQRQFCYLKYAFTYASRNKNQSHRAGIICLFLDSPAGQHCKNFINWPKYSQSQLQASLNCFCIHSANIQLINSLLHATKNYWFN